MLCVSGHSIKVPTWGEIHIKRARLLLMSIGLSMYRGHTHSLQQLNPKKLGLKNHNVACISAVL